MNGIASGDFAVSLQPLPVEGQEGQPTLGRIAMGKMISSDPGATSRGQMQSAIGEAKRSARYVANNRLEGELEETQEFLRRPHAATINEGLARECETITADGKHRSHQQFGQLSIHPDYQGNTRQKDYVPYACGECGAGGEGAWRMQPQNVRNGVGCPCCRSIDEVRTKFASAPQLAGYKLKAWASPSGRADIKSVLYRVVSPDDVESVDLIKASMLQAISKGRIPGETSIRAKRADKALMDAFMVAFPNGTIRVEARRLSSTTSPGPFFRLSTGKRAMRAHRTDQVIRKRGVEALIKYEEHDQKALQQWVAEAEKHGATIVKCVHVMGSQVRVQYISRSGHVRQETFLRAQQSSWGHTRFRKGEKLCQAVLLSLLPNTHWEWIGRHKFLKWNGSTLELDGYCPELRLAFEHQGAHHVEWNPALQEEEEDFKAQVARDAFKIARCAEEGIRLLVVDAMDLDPGLYLDAIRGKLRAIDVPVDEQVTAEDVRARWRQICANPLKRFQDAVIAGLAAHTLLEPPIDKVTPRSNVKYRCATCGEEHDTRAKSLTDGEPRSYCPSCKGLRAGGVRRMEHMDSLRQQLPDEVSVRIRSEPGKPITIVCDEGHHEPASSVQAILARHDGGKYNCPHCRTLALGFADSGKKSRLRAAAFDQNAPAFEAMISKAGLTKTGPITYAKASSAGASSALVATVKCPQEHQFSLFKSELTTLLANTYLDDSNRHIVPTVCPMCCYPGGPYPTKDSTVFHRLAILRTLHPEARYVSGFDPSGHAKEHYACGEVHALSQIPHEEILINFSTLASKTKVARMKSFCYECAEERGVLKPSFDKTIKMVRGRMLVIAEAIAKRMGADTVTVPTAQLAPGQSDVNGFISTTKTRIRFDCGRGHPPEVKTMDAYFARAGGKPGYCRECLVLAGVKSVNELLPSAPDC